MPCTQECDLACDACDCCDLQSGEGEEQGMDFSNVDVMYEDLLDRLDAVDQAAPAAMAMASGHGKHSKVGVGHGTCCARRHVHMGLGWGICCMRACTPGAHAPNLSCTAWGGSM